MSTTQMNIVESTIKEEIESFIKSRIRWRTIGMCMETMSKLLLGTTSIVAFATSIYPCNNYLSFIAGSVSTMSLVTLQFANYSFRESKLSTDNLNILLSKINSNSIPDLNGSVLKEKSLSLDKITKDETAQNEHKSEIENKKETILKDEPREKKERKEKKEITILPQLKTPDTEIVIVKDLMNI